MDQLYNKLLRKSTEVKHFEFDEQTYTIRKNLMLFSSLAIALTFISPFPKTGDYEVNLGIIKGVIDNPILVYIFLDFVCGYYLIWFYFHCRRLVVPNYLTIRNSFEAVIALMHAREKFKELTKVIGPAVLGEPKFTYSAFGEVKGVLGIALNDHPEMMKNIREKSEFIITENNNAFYIHYVHKLDDRDLIYLNSHLDQFFRLRKEEIIVTVLPIAYSTLSIILIAFHIVKLLKI